MSNNRSSWSPFLLGIDLAIGILIGNNFQKKRFTNYFKDTSSTINPIDEALDLINTYYVEDPEIKNSYDPVIEKLVSELDPHSYYIRAKDMQGVNDEMNGNFEGIGVEFFIVKDTIQVVSPIPGGPSDLLGILSGDQIIKVNDTTVAGVGITNDDVLKKLKGPKGTTVNVSIKRAGQNELIPYTIKRNKIPLYSVDAGFKINDSTGYIKIGRFSGQTYNEFSEKLTALKKDKISQLIIDLRQNPGGFLEEAVKIISEIIGDKREIVYIEGRTVPKQSYYAERDGYFLKGKIAILIDEGSASASEILAGAVQDWDRGVIIGRRSFGKGLVQQQYPLSNGAALRLTIAKYYTPSGRSIQRPYVKGHGDEYNHDIEDRYKNGELFTADDNLALAQQDTANEYFTKNLNRPVFGGGGIAPDFHVPFDTTFINAFSLQVFAGGWIQEYTYDYYNKHSSELKAFKSVQTFNNNFQITEDLYQSFINYCIKTKKAKHPELLNSSVKREITIRLKAAIARQMFSSNGYIYVTIQQDPTVLKTLEILKMKDYPYTK